MRFWLIETRKISVTHESSGLNVFQRFNASNIELTNFKLFWNHFLRSFSIESVWYYVSSNTHHSKGQTVSSKDFVVRWFKPRESFAVTAHVSKQPSLPQLISLYSHVPAKSLVEIFTDLKYFGYIYLFVIFYVKLVLVDCTVIVKHGNEMTDKKLGLLNVKIPLNQSMGRFWAKYLNSRLSQYKVNILSRICFGGDCV